jgi:hypothetical protein
MIKNIKLDIDFKKLLSEDYSKHYGSCIGYQRREQEDLHDKYGKGFPKSYHEDNTRIQQLWFDDGDIDYTDLGEKLGMEVITVSTILQPPGNVITLHRDTFFQINKKYPDDSRNKIRANIYMQDWQPGHFINYQDESLEWQTSTHWKQGDGFIWDSNHLHLSANAGLLSKFTMQISGFLN